MVITMKKRLISFILTVVMLFAIVPTAFAASDKAVAAANALHELGLFNGTGTDANGNPVYDLDRAPSRHEAVTMLVRLLGKETEAQNGTWNTPFSDVAEWAKPYVGYAYTNGLTAGTSATTFGGNGTVTAAQYITFVLRALGYESGVDFQWDKSWELSDSIGLTNGEYNANTSKFTRGDVAIISNNALQLPLKGSDVLLCDTINTSDTSALSADKITGTWYNTDLPNVQASYNNGVYTEAHRGGDGSPMLYREGTYVLDGNKLSVHINSGLCEISGNRIIEAAQTDWAYELVSIDNNSIVFPYGFGEETTTTFLRAEDDSFITGVKTELQTLADKDGITKIDEAPHSTPSQTPQTVNSADYAYLAGTDFRSIRRNYSTATAQCAYVYAYNNIDGDLCVMTCVQYKIISNYNQFTLHNMTTGSTIKNPDSYYQKLADRSAGMTRIHYMDLSSEVLKYQVKMLEATRSCLSGGANTWNGVYVTAAELNQ
jgi:hypothetical protein